MLRPMGNKHFEFLVRFGLSSGGMYVGCKELEEGVLESRAEA